MRSSRPRFTVRRLMIASAIVGMILGAGLMGRRSAECRRRAGAHERIAMEFRQKEAEAIAFLEGLASHGMSRVVVRDWKINEKMRAYHESMARKYQQAASRPWLPIEPDPPAPDS